MAVICKKCGLPDDLCACGELEKEDTRIIVRLEKRRFSKTTTMIEGIDPKQSDVQSIIKELKSRFACGGTAKDGFIMCKVTIEMMSRATCLEWASMRRLSKFSELAHPH